MADKRRLVDVLEGLPLAICLAASYLRPVRSIDSFLSTHQRLLSIEAKRAPNKLYWDQSRKELRALSATFKISLDALRVALGDDAPRGLPAVCAAGVAPLVGVRIGWLAAIMGVEKADAEGWLSDALTLSIVQHDAKTGRWRVHKLLGEHLRGHTDADAAVARKDGWVLDRLPGKPQETRGARWGALQAEHDAVAEWVAGLDGARAAVGSVVGFDYASASGPYTAWLGAVERGLLTTQDGKAWSALLWIQGHIARQAGDLDLAVQAAELKADHDGAHGWDRGVALAVGLRADVLQARGQLDEALRNLRDEELHIYERLGDVRGKAITMGRIADGLQARGQLDEALRIQREEVLPILERLGDVSAKATTMATIADGLQARGLLDEALRIRRDEVLPVVQRLGDAQGKAITMGKIADVLRARGQLDEALRIQREEVLPILERLGDVRTKAITMGKIADVLQAQGQLDEALRILQLDVLPVYERLGDRRELLVGQANLAFMLLLLHRPKHRNEARTLLTTALKSAVDLNLPLEVEQIRSIFRKYHLRPPT